MNTDKKSSKEKIERKKKTYSFSGIVTGKIEDKDYNSNEDIYRLKVKIEDEEEIKELRAYERKVNKKVWENIKNDEYFDKRYILSCEKVYNSYHLKDWKEMLSKSKT